MPKISCRCGRVLEYGEIPNPIEWLTIGDVAFDQFKGWIDPERVYLAMTHVHAPTVYMVDAS